MSMARLHKTYSGHPVVRNLDPYNPLDLPPRTIRLKYKPGAVCSIHSPYGNYFTLTQVSEEPNIWDITGTDPILGGSWSYAFENDTNIIEVLGGNLSGDGYPGLFYHCSSLAKVNILKTDHVSSMFRMFCGTAITSIPLFDTSSVYTMYQMFDGCKNLISIPLFDTSNVEDMEGMLAGCESLTSIPLLNTAKVTTMRIMLFDCINLKVIPLFDTSKVTNMEAMASNCFNVESGALALYQQASSQTVPPSVYSNCFRDCGIYTITGAAELAQIPTSWGGTAP